MPNGTARLEAEYTKGQILGRGASGVAFIVRPKRAPERKLVAKEMCIVKSDDKRRREALAECDLLRNLKHNNIIMCFDVVIDTDMLYIVMEYADGGDLSRWIQVCKDENRWLLEQTVMVSFVQICAALEYIHSRKILHRDLKPANIFVLGQAADLGACTIKLGDFGIAKMIDCTMGNANSTVGTPSYLSPEICKNNPYGMKADIWSLGVVLYEMTCLKVPFHAGNLPAMALMICTSEPKPVPDDYSKSLSDLIWLLLQKDPTKRPTVAAVLEQPYVKGFVAIAADAQRAAAASTPPPPPPEGGAGGGGQAPAPGPAAFSFSGGQGLFGASGGSSCSSSHAQGMLPVAHTAHARDSSQPSRPSRPKEEGASRLPSCGPPVRQRPERYPGFEDGGSSSSQAWCWHRAGERAGASRGSASGSASGPTPRATFAPARTEGGLGGGSSGSRGGERERDRGQRSDRGGGEAPERQRGDAAEAEGSEPPSRGERAKGRTLERLAAVERAPRPERGDRERDRERTRDRSDRRQLFGEHRGDHRAEHRASIGSQGDRGDRDGDEAAEPNAREAAAREAAATWAAVDGGPTGSFDGSGSFSTPRKGILQTGDMNIESVLPTPEHNLFARTDEDLTGLNGNAGDVGESAQQWHSVPPPAETYHPSPPNAEPPSSSSMLTALMAGTLDSQPRMRHRNRRRPCGRPPLLLGQEVPENQDGLRSPSLQVPERQSSASSYAGGQSVHLGMGGIEQLFNTAPLPSTAASSGASCFAARSASPTRSCHVGSTGSVGASSVGSGGRNQDRGNYGGGGCGEQLPVPGILRGSGSAPSLPPLPKILAPRPTFQRSRSVVGMQDPRDHGKGYGSSAVDASQSHPRSAAHLFRTAPLPVSAGEVGSGQGSSFPPSVVSGFQPPQGQQRLSVV